MLRQTNSFSRRFYHQELNNIDQSQFPQPINCYQMMSPEFCAYDESGFQTNQFSFYRSEPGQCSPGFSTGLPIRGHERKTEESKVVDELLQILVECLKEADMKTREVLLRKCFYEIEKEIPLERFLVDRVKHSRVKLLSDSLQKIQQCSGDIDDCRIISNDKNNTKTNYCVSANRELVELSLEEENPKKLERFKVKTVLIGEIVRRKPDDEYYYMAA